MSLAHIRFPLGLSALLWLTPACAHSPHYHYQDSTKGGMQRFPNTRRADSCHKPQLSAAGDCY